MRVLAIDPGERCGYCTAEVKEGAWLLRPPSTYMQPGELPSAKNVDYGRGMMPFVQTHGIAYLKDMALSLHEKAGEYDVIIFEDYRISSAKLRAHVGSNVPTLQMIGMIRLCAWVNPKVQLVTQMPAHKRTADKVIAANPIFADIKRRIDNAPATHDEAHDTDALRHLAYWFFNRWL